MCMDILVLHLKPNYLAHLPQIFTFENTPTLDLHDTFINTAYIFYKAILTGLSQIFTSHKEFLVNLS